MTDSLDRIKRDYRQIKAPPYLATRIAANIREQRPIPRRIPALVTAAFVLAVIGVLPFADRGPDEMTAANTPSLSRLASLKPAKPNVSTPGLSKIRTVSRPPLPRKPVRPQEPPRRGQDSVQLMNEETNHVHI